MLKKNTFYLLSSIFIIMPLIKYFNWQSNYADFGIFENIIYNFSKGLFTVVFDGHFSPVYSIFGSLLFVLNIFSIEYLVSYIALLIQSLCILSPALFFFYKKKYFLANIYLLFPPIWFLNYNDFHIDTLVIPILFFSIYSYHNFKSSNLYFFLILSLILIKEYYATLVFFFAIYIFVDEKKLKQSIILILISLFFLIFYYFYIKQLFTISSLSLAGDSEFYSGFIGNNIFEIFINLFKNIDVYFKNLFNFKKLFFLIFFVFYFLLFKYFNYRLIIIIFPLLFINFLSLNLTFVSLANHHTVSIISVLAYNLYLFENKFYEFFSKYNLKIFYILIFFIFTPNYFSPYFYLSKYELFSFNNVENIKRNIKIKNDLSYLFDQEHSLSVQNNLSNNILSLRSNYFLFPEGVFLAKNKKIFPSDHISILADYVILDLKKELFIYDKRCLNFIDKCTSLSNDLVSFKDLFNRILESQSFTLKYQYDDFYVFEKIN